MPTLHQPPVDAELEAQIEAQIEQVTMGAIKNIELYGWAVTSIKANQETAASRFAFTTGFTLTLGVPEVVVCGHEYWWTAALINSLGMRLLFLPPDERLRAIADGATMHDLLRDGCEVGFHSLGSYKEAGCLHVAANVLGHDFPVVQVLIPDRDNHLPTSPTCDPDVARCQAWPPSRN